MEYKCIINNKNIVLSGKEDERLRETDITVSEIVMTEKALLEAILLFSMEN